MSLLKKGLKNVPKEDLERMVITLFENMTTVTTILLSKNPDLRDSAGMAFVSQDGIDLLDKVGIPRKDWKQLAAETHEGGGRRLQAFVDKNKHSFSADDFDIPSGAIN